MPAGPQPYARQWLLWLDCGLNVLCGGYHAETFSAHCWRRRYDPFWYTARRVVDWLFFWQPNHCEIAYRNMIERHGLPDEYSNPYH